MLGWFLFCVVSILITLWKTRKPVLDLEDFTAAEKATAEELGISVEEVRSILDTYLRHTKLSAAKSRMLRKD